MTEFNAQLHMIVPSMYDQGKVVAVSRLHGGYLVPAEARPILVKLVELIMRTDYTKQDTKDFLMSHHRGLRSCAVSPGCSANKNTSRSRIQYDLTKLRSVLGPDFFGIVLEGGDLSRQAEAVDRLMKRAHGRSLLERYLFPLPSPTGEVEELDEESRAKLIELTGAFATTQATCWSTQFTPSMVNYIAYLENHQRDLTGEDKTFYEQLQAILIG